MQECRMQNERDSADVEENALYLIKANAPINTEAYSYAQTQLSSGKIKFLIDESMAKDILLGLTATDFSEVRHNEHRGFEHELLYIFGKDVKLVERFGNSDKLVSLYIKFNKLENCYVIVVSLHEQKYPLKYYFK